MIPENNTKKWKTVLITMSFSVLTAFCDSFAFFSGRVFSVLGASTLQKTSKFQCHK